MDEARGKRRSGADRYRGGDGSGADGFDESGAMISGETVRGFGELESEIMDFVWDADGPVLCRQVCDAINEQRPIAYTSVQTVMEILHRKGWLKRARDGRAYRYQAVHSREDYAASLIDQVFASGADRTATLVKLVEQMDPDEAESLHAALGAAKAAKAAQAAQAAKTAKAEKSGTAGKKS